MSSTTDYIEYVCGQIEGTGIVRYRKMFGEYMVYVNEKPVLIVCDNTPFVKKLDCIADIMKNADTGFPYTGAKEHYVLDIDNADSAREIISLIEKNTEVPKKKNAAKRT